MSNYLGPRDGGYGQAQMSSARGEFRVRVKHTMSRIPIVHLRVEPSQQPTSFPHTLFDQAGPTPVPR